MESDTTRRAMLATGGVAAVAASQVMAAEAPAEAAKGMKILAVCCSPRKGKNTALGLQACLDAAAGVAPGIQTELIELADLSIPGEPAVGLKPPAGVKDDFPAVAAKLTDPAVGGIVIGTPVYFGNMSYLCKAFLDRGVVFRRKGFSLAGKVAGVLACGGARNGGQELTLQSVHAVLLSQQVLPVGTAPPTARIGAALWSGAKGGAKGDEVGLAMARDLGKRVARVALALGGKKV